MPGDASPITVDSEVMQGTRDALSAGAEHLQSGLKDLDADVLDMLARWNGAAGGSYSQAWQQWHTGAQKVQASLAAISEWIGEGGRMFEANEQASEQKIGSVHDG